eukprot:CAMPEP_0170552888 /NCGR_PEP_ID=MMETSP0211-20121228/10780_1 /TAXON_ID=311385 /ORGANISM="Pseudokeronopsis sp., Strain OXSARD2" /LENGTH=61 /DNA_ID=CAMNT_0010860927 /DNA_START=735 /DNA_END=920 /DNA_ORIENTATION=-
MKDDLESIAYTIIYLLLGHIPWDDQHMEPDSGSFDVKYKEMRKTDWMIRQRDPPMLCLNLD